MKHVMILFLSLSIIAQSATGQPGATKPWVTAYYPTWFFNALPPEEIDFAGLTHIVLFLTTPSRIPPYTHILTGGAARLDSIRFEAYGEWTGRNYLEEIVRRSHGRGVKVLLSVGGAYGNRETMTYITVDDRRMRQFVSAICAYVRRKGMDGIEVDWEIPQKGESSQFLRLSQMLRDTLKAYNAKAQLIMALPYGPYGDFGSPARLSELYDQINVMAYDMYVGDWQDIRSGFNAPLRRPLGKYPDYRGISLLGTPGFGMEAIIQRGFDRAKVGLGVPFFTHAFDGTSEPNKKFSGHAFGTYREVWNAMEAATRFWDEESKVPWLALRNRMITYDDSLSVAIKAKHALDLGLGGIMIYDLGSGYVPEAPRGTRHPLLASIRSVLNPGAKSIEGIRFSVKPDTIPGTDATIELRWEAPGATSVRIEPFPGSVKSFGKHDLTSLLPVRLTMRVERDGETHSFQRDVVVRRGGRLYVDVTAGGRPIASVERPGGIGSRSLGVLRDSFFPSVETGKPTDQYDTFTTEHKEGPDWVGYTFNTTHDFLGLLFQEGAEFGDGGWMRELSVQVRQGGTWRDVQGLKISPQYVGMNRRGYEIYALSFRSQAGDAIRIVGTLGGGSSFISVAELRVYGSPR